MIEEMPAATSALASRVEIPYRLAAGRATGFFLGGLLQAVIIGSQCDACGRIEVPAQDSCNRCGAGIRTLLQMPQRGKVVAVTTSGGHRVGLVQIDGADNALLHRLIGTEAPVAIGASVEAVWSEQRAGTILDLRGFQPLSKEGGSDHIKVEAARIAPDESSRIIEQPEFLKLEYHHEFGAYYGRFFDELRYHRRLLGVRCSKCHRVLVPPRPVCEVCFAPTAEWAEVADTGILAAFSVIHLRFEGQLLPPPYIYAEIVLDGSSTRLIHTLGGIDVARAEETLIPGTRVKAVWREERVGALTDIVYFMPIDG